MLVGITDTYMANHLKKDAAAGTAAVGTISYFLWFVGLLVTSIGTGATALIARAKGARHRSLANSVTGQSIGAGIMLGIVISVLIWTFAHPLIVLTDLKGAAPPLAQAYLRMLAFAVPFSTLMFIANSCLRGAGDTLTPALVMIVVDAINMFFTYSLTVGACGLPEMGFNGIAVGTIIAYIAGGLIQLVVLLSGVGGVRLYLHRLWPHWLTLKRLFRIGAPSGAEGLLVWAAQLTVIIMINGMDATNKVTAAHNNAVKIEAISYMMGYGFAMAAATLVGQALGAKNPRRATRAAYLSYGVGAGVMAFWGLVFILFGRFLSGWMSNDPQIAALTTRCLFITGWIQFAFAASIIFSGALRGAGDTVSVMVLNLISILLVRCLGVVLAVQVFHASLAAIWVILCIELTTRGTLVYLRFLQGNWRHVQV